jgi:hypothetical protein
MLQNPGLRFVEAGTAIYLDVRDLTPRDPDSGNTVASPARSSRIESENGAVQAALQSVLGHRQVLR